MAARTKAPIALRRRELYDMTQALAVIMTAALNVADEAQAQARAEAVLRAYDHLIRGCEWQRNHDGSYSFTSQSEPHIQHTATRLLCDCRARSCEPRRECWHRPAAAMLATVQAAQLNFKRRDEKIDDEIAADVAVEVAR